MDIILNKNRGWYSLDNAAKIYPAITNARSSYVFRVAVNLKEDIKPEILQQAIIESRRRFPTMFVKLKKGLFWYYLESNGKMPLLKPEGPFLGHHIDKTTNNGYLFCFYYYRNRIALEVFHSLCDGGSAIELLKSVVFHYFQLQGKALDSEGLVITKEQAPDNTEIEDSFIKNYAKQKRAKSPVKKAYHVKSKKMPLGVGNGVINGKLSAKEFVALSKKSQATVTQYLVANLIYAIAQAYGPRIPRKRPINVSIPVNLRKFFNSNSLRNFTLFFHTSVYHHPGLTFDEVLGIVKESFQTELTQEKMQQTLNANVSAEKNMALRLTPLFLKKLALSLVANTLGSNLETCAMSNIGVVKIPSGMKPLIQDFEFNLPPENKLAFGIGVITFEDEMNVCFCRSIVSNEVERFFFSRLASLGLKVSVESNLREEVV